MKLWGGRFRSEENKLMEDFNRSFDFDSLLYKKDIEGSLAHVYMQVQVNLLSEEEGKIIIDGLKSIEKDIDEGKLLLKGNYEDIHSISKTIHLEAANLWSWCGSTTRDYTQPCKE